jgi:enoyl-CoA hydratase/carnithine racemase
MVRVARDDLVVVITLDRPERRNAVDLDTLLRLRDVQREIEAAGADVRAVVLTGTPPAFSAGADLHGVEEGRFAGELGAVLAGFCALAVPVVAAVEGPALGAGAQLAVAADLRIATPGSVIGVPAAKLGIAVDHWTIRRMVSEFTAPVARAMLVGAETYTGERLHALGGVQRLGGLDEALAWAHELARLAPLTMAAHKVGLEHAFADPVVDPVFEAARTAAWASDDATEGRTAFLDKRSASFTGH